jgi:hypothetical protein
MPRLQRLDFRGAIHSVVIRGRNEDTLFFELAVLTRSAREVRGHAPGVQRFEQLLDDACIACGTGLYAYSIEPKLARLIVQTGGTPLHALMLRLCGRYSRWWRVHHGTRAAARGPFASRYEAKVVAPEYLPHAVRRVHASAHSAGLQRVGIDYPFSSERVYAGSAKATVLLDAGGMSAALERRGLFGMRGYREFMAQPESPHVANLLDRGSPLDSRIVGSKLFVAQVRDHVVHPPPLPTREELMTGVARLIRGARAVVPLPDSHEAALRTALVGWYGLRSGAAPLEDIARWFSVTRVALAQGIRHYRRTMPELFNQTSLPGMED